MIVKTYRLYTGEDGHSYVEQGCLEPDLKLPVETLHYKISPPGSVSTLHNAPATNYVITLLGEVEFETSRGHKFTIKPGDLLMAEDIHGLGHSWKILGTDPWVRYYAVYPANQGHVCGFTK